MCNPDLLVEQVISQWGPVRRVRGRWQGIYPGTGTITKPWTGWETVEETNEAVGIRAFAVTRAMASWRAT
jgi:hypothetical protein